ncbi:MAG: sugar transferase [Verrucomicrobiaceae bacterium]|nr:sugar transferase [Verrucomicrobiaceae bacterium]
MLGRKQEINLQINQILDSCLIALVFWGCHALRYYNPSGWFGPVDVQIPEFGDFLWELSIVVPFTPVVLEMFGYYEHPLQKSVWRSLRQLGKTLVVIGVIIGGCVVFFKWGAQSRVVLVMVTFVGGGALLLKEAFIRMHLRSRIRERGWREDILIAGDRSDMDTLRRQIENGGDPSLNIVSMIDLGKSEVEEFVSNLHEYSPERVVFAAGQVKFSRIQEAISACEAEGVEAWLSTDFIRTSIARPSLDVLGGATMMVFRSAPGVSWAISVKELYDRVGAALIIFLTLPFWALAWIGIKLCSPGPVIFRQQRGGKNGRAFSMYKFRTMGIDAEKNKASLESENEMSGPVFKVENDPRIFRFGGFLRRWSIDELPQLLNVLLGQMSLVGPRPLPVDEVARIEHSAQRRRLSMKPGLTCLWQVSGRNSITSFDEWVELDLKYIDNWSIWLDCKVLLLTVPAVFCQRGAK